MPVNLSAPGSLLPINGVEIGVAESNIRYQGRDDLVLMTLASNSTVAAVYTQNKYCAAPVLLCKEHTAQQATRALLINAGNANAGTGTQGMKNAKQSCEMVAQAIACEAQAVLPFSTGVIGEQLPMEAVQKGIKIASENLKSDNWSAAAAAIMTTDTVAKAISKQVVIDGKTITITGITKGSGMICPNMATMLGYVATDANIEQATLQAMLSKANDQSFNRITVDSDTSTNDALVLVATAKADNPLIETLDSNVRRCRGYYDY